MRTTIIKAQILTAVLTIAALAVGQSAIADTVTYGIDGTYGPNGNGDIIVNLNITASGSATGTVSNSWNYISTQSISDMSLPGYINLSFGSDNTSSLLVRENILGIKATGTTGGYITLSHASKYIYHVTLKNRSGEVVHEAWNMTNSYEYRFQTIEVKFIEVEYATAIPITDAVISGINDNYVVSNTAVTPTPTVTWHGTTLTKGTHYSLSYQNNTSAGTATVKATGKGKFSSNVTKSYTLVWATYAVRFNKNNDSAEGTMDNQAFTYATAQNLTANSFTRIGYTFSGWSTTPGGSVVYTDGQEVLNLTTTDGVVVDLYAHWTANTYSVTLDNQSATTVGTTSVTATYDAAMPVITVPARTGYTFGGYYTAANGGGTKYYNADGTSSNSWNIASATTLYAQWTVNTYTVTLDNQSATTAGSTSVTATYDAAMPVITVPARTGYTFGGYYTEANGGGTKYYNADGSSANSWNIASTTTTLYAYWTYDWEGDGTAEDPYQISSYAGLKEFANIVNGTYGEANPNACTKLLADIVCKNSSGDTEYATDWVPIGNDSHPYTGTFDGQGYSITALSTPTDNSSDYQGLFGYIGSGGVVKNVILDNATITGTNYVGVIAGFNGGTLTANYYLDCSVNSATTNIGTGSGDTDGARSVHSLTLGDNITASGESVDIGETTYYAAGATVTLSYSGEVPEGYRVYYTVKDASDNDVTMYKDNGEYTFIMPASNITITATTKEILWETGSSTIATWEGNRKGAATFTFDDGAPSHVSDAGPLFKKYGYKATFFLVTGWSNTNWSGFLGLADEGHEIGSHSDTHVDNMSGQEASSKRNINNKIDQPYGCITLAYPYGNVPSVSTVMQNYIAGRIFNGSVNNEPDIMGKDGPSNWAKCPALMTGSESNIKNTADFTATMQQAVNSEGWVMFATHGFLGKNNGSATYSPTDLGAIEGALEWAQEHDDDIWVTTFRNGVMYVKERKASSVTLTDEEKNRLTFTLTHSIADDVCPYDYPLTLCITAEQDDGYDYVITQNGKVIDDVKTDGTTFMFQAIPNGGNIVVTRIPRMDLANNADNTSVINDHNGETVNVTLQGRTLYRDGAWNTLCLPFEVSIADGPLSGDGVKAMTLDTDNSGVSGSTLTLKFTEVSLSGEQGGLIPAGTPFIIKWEDNVSGSVTNPYNEGSVTNPYNEGSVTNPYNGGNIEDPLFSSVIIDANASTDITSTDGKVTFTGSYDPMPFTANDRTKLYLGAQDKLYYPGKNMTLGAFRAYFQLKGISMSDISETRIFFEEEDRPTITEVREVKEVKDDRWYDLQGRSLSPTLPSREGRPQGKGMYIVNGKKIMVK